MVPEDAQSARRRADDQMCDRMLLDSQVQAACDMPKEMPFAAVLEILVVVVRLMAMIGAFMNDRVASVRPALCVGG